MLENNLINILVLKSTTSFTIHYQEKCQQSKATFTRTENEEENCFIKWKKYTISSTNFLFYFKKIENGFDCTNRYRHFMIYI